MKDIDFHKEKKYQIIFNITKISKLQESVRFVLFCKLHHVDTNSVFTQVSNLIVLKLREAISLVHSIKILKS